MAKPTPMQRATARASTRGPDMITRQALARMRSKTAKQQLAEAFAALAGPEDIPETDDADDASLRGVMR